MSSPESSGGLLLSRPRRFARLILVGAAIVFTLLLSGSSADQKRISIYSTAANYSLPVTERDGRDYVGLVEILDPVGPVSAKTDGQHWKLHYKNVDGEFTAGRTGAKIRGKDFDLSANFLLENRRGLVPLTSLSTLMPRFLGGPVTFHENGRRLFIGSVATQFSAELSKTTPPRLVMNFSSPVNPTISTEPGKLHMVFVREPLVPLGSQTLNFGDKTISSAIYQENNGAAEVMVTGSASLMASFSNDRRTITITAAPPTAQNQTQMPTPPIAPANVAPIPVIPSIPITPASARHFFAVVDASHGGDERGAALTDKLAEKDVTLAIARYLRQELESRGISVLMLRDSDTYLGLDQRAALANNVHPTIFISVHASSQGSGVRLYTALIPSGDENRGTFLAWDTAQSSFLTASQGALGSVASELQKKLVPVRTLVAPLRPLNNITAAALAVEVAPPGSDTIKLRLPDYQQFIASAVANGVAALRDRLGMQR